MKSLQSQQLPCHSIVPRQKGWLGAWVMMHLHRHHHPTQAAQHCCGQPGFPSGLNQTGPWLTCCLPQGSCRVPALLACKKQKNDYNTSLEFVLQSVKMTKIPQHFPGQFQAHGQHYQSNQPVNS